MIAKLNVGSLGTQSAGKDPIYRYLSSGIRSISCLSEVLSMTKNFSLLYFASTINTRISNCTVKLKRLILFKKATIIGLFTLL